MDHLERPVENNEFRGARDLFPFHEFAAFHNGPLRDLLGQNAPLANSDVADLAPVALRVGNEEFTYRPTDSGLTVEPGSDAASTLVSLSAESFSDFVNEIHSVSGLAMGGKLEFVRGDLGQLHRWEPALRAIYSGRPIWTPEAVRDLVDAAGNPLDLSRRFSLDEDDTKLRAYLEAAGFLHVTGVFSRHEIEALGEEVDRVRAALEPGTGDCWWSTTTDGRQVITRINYLDRWSEILHDIGFDQRVARLGKLLGDHFRVCSDRLDGPMAFIKNSSVAQGLGDLQWHQDDGLGGHSVMCPLMQVGVQLDPASPDNGQLWVLAGSHRYTNHPIAWGEEDGMPVVRFVTEPGDVTVHYGDIYHTTPPPTGANAGRRVLYFKFAEPKTFAAIPAGAHYNDLLFKAGEGQRVATRADTWEEGDTQEGFERKVVGD